MTPKKLFDCTLLLIVICLSACGSPKPESVANTYWQSVIKSDAEQIAEVTSSSSRGELSRSIAPHEDSSVTFGETQIEDDLAQVETFLTWIGEDQEQADFELFTLLVKENDHWKIDTAKTRQQFFTAVYRSSLDGLGAALAESLASFQILGEQAAGTMAEELGSAIEEMQIQSSQANDDVQQFLQALDEDLRDVIEELNQEP